MKKFITEDIPVYKKTVYLNKFEKEKSKNEIVEKKEVMKSTCIKEIFGVDAEILEFSKENIQFDYMNVNWDKLEISRAGDQMFVVNKLDEENKKPYCCSCCYFSYVFDRLNKKDFINFVDHIKGDTKEVLIVTSKSKLEGDFDEREGDEISWTDCKYKPLYVEMPYFKWVSSDDKTVADLNSAYSIIGNYY